MVHDKSFIIWDGVNCSSEKFLIKEGLQQGTVNSPCLFNIFNSDILNLFDLNSDNYTHSKAFADDLIILVAGKHPIEIQFSLENLVNKVNDYYQSWNLKLNPNKCESILFQKPSRYLSKFNKCYKNEFKITTTIPGTDIKTDIPHKKVVKYLGVHIDYLVRMNKHHEIQLKKARGAFIANHRLFYNKNLQKKAKVICYQMLIRPIITYAFPVLWNINSSVSEKFRAFERECLRKCLWLHRSQSSNFRKKISNRVLYNAANIPRIDNFALKITRDYFSNLHSIDNNLIKDLIKEPSEALIAYTERGYIPPQAFTELDTLGIFQDDNNVPILYHRRRHKANKSISLDNAHPNTHKDSFVYNRAIPDRDLMDMHRLHKKYWWLTSEAKYIDELKSNMKIKKTALAANRILSCER